MIDADMNASARSRILWLVFGVAVAVVVAVVAYNVGFDNGRSAGNAGGFFGSGFHMMYGYGAFSLLGPLLFIGLLVGLFVLVLTPFGGPRREPWQAGTRPQPPMSGVDQLQQLADLHARGELNDEEFAAAKRRLLGL